MNRARSACTLTELLVTVAIIAVLAGLLFPVFGAARNKAQRTTCLNNLYQLGRAMEMYRADHDHQRPTQLWSLYPRYATDARLFVCPEDTWTAERGYAVATRYSYDQPLKSPITVSYAYPWQRVLRYDDRVFAKVEALPGRPGYCACVLHGKKVWLTHSRRYPPYYIGTALRLCLDGSVIVTRTSGPTDGYSRYMLTDLPPTDPIWDFPTK